MVYRFGRYELDEEAGELRRDGKAVDVQPKPFAVLAFLLRERERVVPSDELLETLWPGTAVTPGSLTRAVSFARRAIGDSHKGELLRSYSRRGYRFCGDVVEVDRAAARGGAQSAPAAEPEGGTVDPGRLFVGRGDALLRLRDGWTRAASGEGSVVVVTGPAGVGKTRLVEVFAAETEARGARVVAGRCREGEGVPAFWLWAQVLRGLLEAGALGDELEEVAAHADELAELLPELAARAAGAPAKGDRSPERQRFLLFDAVARALARVSRSRPLVLVLEDLHWAGSPSLRLLEHLVYEAADDPILIVATVRDDLRDRTHPLHRTVAAARQLDRCIELELRGLSRGEVGALLEGVLGRPAPPDLTSELFARTEGIPLFLREAIRLLAERGALTQPERIAREGIALPARALDLIRRALDVLSEPGARVVAAAAVLGREFSLPTVAAVADVPREEALDLLDEATRAGVVEATPGGVASYRFVHALYQETAYGGLAAGERTRLHLRAAQRLEAQHGEDLDPVIAELAHHHHQALAVGDPERALAVAQRAAERATQLLAHEQAALHYEQAVAALEHVEGAEPGRRLTLLLALGDAYRLAGDRPRRRQVFAEAMRSARAQERALDFIRAAIGLCDLSEWGAEDEEARAALHEAIVALGRRDGIEEAQLRTRQAYMDVMRAPAKAEPLARRAVELALAAGDPDTLQDALYTLHFAIGGPDGLEERGELAPAIVRAAEDSRSTDRAVIALLDVACDRLQLGDLAEARRLRAEAGRLAGERPNLAARWHLGVWDTGLALLEGRLAEVGEAAHATFVLGRRIEHPYARGCVDAHLTLLRRERGDWEGALAGFQRALRARQGPIHWVKAVVGRTHLAAGHEEEGRALFEELAAGDFEDVPRNLRWSASVAEIAHLCADLRDEGRAKRLRDLVEPAASQHGVIPMAICYAGPLSRALARLCGVLGRTDEVAPLFEEALESCEALGARPMRARTALDFARFLARRDRRRAAGLAEESARDATAIGMADVAKASGDLGRTLAG